MDPSIIRQAIVSSIMLELIATSACRGHEGTTLSTDETQPADGSTNSRDSQIWEPNEGDHLWVFADSRDKLGSGGEFHIYIDPETHPDARASFSKFALGVGGALPEHRHDKTEEIAYFVSGQGVARIYVDGEPRDVKVAPGYVWYNPPRTWHSIANTGEEPLELVFATVPNEKKGLLSFFRKIAVKPGHEPVTLPPEEFAEIATQHDMILRPPEAKSDTIPD